MKFCTNCGFKMNDDVKFCPKCGAQQPMNMADNNNGNSGRFTGGSEFDGNPQPQRNNQQVRQNNYGNDFNGQYQNSFNNNQQARQNNYGNNFNGQYQNNFNNNQQYQQSYADGFTIGQPNHLDFSQSMSYIWANKFDFSPTVQDNQKSIFWWSQLLIIFLSIAVVIVIGTPAIVLDSVFGAFLMYAIIIVLELMEIPPIMRRLNYLGQSKNLAWLYFVPIAQFYILYLMFTDRSQINHA